MTPMECRYHTNHVNLIFLFISGVSLSKVQIFDLAR